MMNLSLHNFNWVDYTIIGIVVFSTIISFFRGFVREAVSFVVWTIGVLLALRFADPLQTYFKANAWIHSPILRYVIAFVVIFLLVLLIGVAINSLIHLAVSKVGLSLMDRLIGIFFGAARGALIVAVLLMFATVGNVHERGAVAQSRLAADFNPLVTWLNNFVPKRMKQFSHWVMGSDNRIDANDKVSRGEN